MQGPKQRQAVRGKTPRGGVSKRAKKLNQAAENLLNEKADAIAQMLCDTVVDGRAVNARLLFDLAMGDPEDEEAMKALPFRSIAAELAAELEWKPKPHVGSAEDRAA